VQSSWVGPGLIAVALFTAYAYFYQAGGWNQNSRFALVRAVVEQGTTRIDDYHLATGDKSRVDGHFYSDKAPGLSLTAIPLVAVAQPMLSLLGVESSSHRSVVALSYLVTVFASGVPVVIAALLLYWLALHLGASSGGAAFGAVAFGLATPVWPYATLFFGHALALSCLFGAFTGAARLSRDEALEHEQWMAVGIGLAAGWATITEFTAALPAAAIALFSVARVWGSGSERRVRVGVGIAIGAVSAAGVLAVYNTVTFGSAFSLGYSSLQGFPGMKQGFMGITYPKSSVLFDILFSKFRGLFPLAPVLIAAPIGVFLFRRRSENRVIVLVAAGIALYYMLLNASYHYWSGGWSYGPRHMAAAIPFLCVPLGLLWTRCGRVGRTLLSAAAVAGFCVSLVGVSTTAQPPESYKNPVGELLWPAFRDGDLSLNHQSFVEYRAQRALLRANRNHHDAWNLGELAGLRGHLSLLPLFLVWMVCAWLWRRHETSRRVE